MKEYQHLPVMLEEVLSYLDRKGSSLSYFDGTFGRGGHSLALAKTGQLKDILAIDRDPQAINAAQKLKPEFKELGVEIHLHHGCFDEFENFMSLFPQKGFDLVLLDLGVSSPQLDDPERGFSFNQTGPLDMRMDSSRGESAAELIARLNEKDLADLIYEYGEERASRKIAKAICEHRKRLPIKDTYSLASIVDSVVSSRPGFHPATRTFQALRIAVNRELDILKSALDQFPNYLNEGARIVVLSFHSLEDRIVKHTFKDWKRQGLGIELTKTPERPQTKEVRNNPRSRSVRLRCFEKAAA